MKMNPLFKTEKNKLIHIEDSVEYSTDNLKIIDINEINNTVDLIKNNQITAITVPWNLIEIEKESYNEEILASLRDYLKKLEENSCYAFIIPKMNRPLEDSDVADSFIKAMVHTARRIKDCSSVVGFSVPCEFLEKDRDLILNSDSYTQWFINEMNVKHSHYLYFIDSNIISGLKLRVKFSENNFVLYKI